jgi:ATP-dependent Zn protease
VTSDATIHTIEREARRLLAGALATATAMIKTHRHRLDKLSEALVERETLEAADLDVLLGPRELPPDVVPVEAPVPPTRPARS